MLTTLLTHSMSEQKSNSQSMSPSIKNKIAALAKFDRLNGIRHKFINDDARSKTFLFSIENLLVDFSKTHISKELLAAYVEFSEECRFNQSRHNLFSGERINVTEDRAVLHALLRDSSNQGIGLNEPEMLDQARDSEARFVRSYEQINQLIGERTEPVKDIVHVGIGGSSLGTKLVFQALVKLEQKIKIHFIGNIDAHQLVAVLAQCEPKNTLVIGVSKTFTTHETLKNLSTIGEWFARDRKADYKQSLYAVTAHSENAISYGVSETNIVTFPEWVGGRYSVWSAVSLSAALLIGMDSFKRFLAGAASMDRHFYTAELDQNLCFVAAVMDHYYTNFFAAKSKAIFAYDYRLRSLVDYLQQLETESNGKDRRQDGSPVDQPTSPVVWGGVGTDVQHSVFQMLHQGTELIPSEFILVKKPDHDHKEHHRELLANGLAQTAALLAGQSFEEVSTRNDNQMSELSKRAKIFSGERPSTTVLVDRLSPEAIGALLAFYEHRTFCSGVFANINSFDQMGVELGKRLAKQLSPLLQHHLSEEDKKSSDGLDPSTLNLLAELRKP